MSRRGSRGLQRKVETTHIWVEPGVCVMCADATYVNRDGQLVVRGPIFPADLVRLNPQLGRGGLLTDDRFILTSVHHDELFDEDERVCVTFTFDYDWGL